MSASYVTGSHNIKMGFENTWGPGRQRKNTRNAHLTQNYTNNQPQTRSTSGTIRRSQPAYVAYDVGVFVQDSWTIKRLTINPGLRVNWIETGMYESSMAAGRFAPARFIEEEKGLIDFGADYSPRMSAVYDLFGDGRTALKTSWSKYFRNYDGDIAAGPYGKAGERSERRAVVRPRSHPGTNRRRSVPSLQRAQAPRCYRRLRRHRPGQRDRLQPEQRQLQRADAGPTGRQSNLQRQYNNEFTAGVQHQVMPRLAVGAMFYKRRIADLWFEDRPDITDRRLLIVRCQPGTALNSPGVTVAQDINRDPDVAAVVESKRARSRSTTWSRPRARRSTQGIIDSSDTDNDTLYTGFEAIVQHAASRRRDAVRQLDG